MREAPSGVSFTGGEHDLVPLGLTRPIPWVTSGPGTSPVREGVVPGCAARIEIPLAIAHQHLSSSLPVTPKERGRGAGGGES